VDQYGVSHEYRKLSLQVLPPISYFQGWMQLTEEEIKGVMALCEIDNLMPMKEPADKTRMFRTLLKGQILFYFEHQVRKRVEAEDSEFKHVGGHLLYFNCNY
jgi:hypothetical protein